MNSRNVPIGSKAWAGGRPLRVRSTERTANPAGAEEPVAGTRYLTSMMATRPGTDG